MTVSTTARSAASPSFSTARWAAATGGAGAARVDRALQLADFLGQFARGTAGEFVAYQRPSRGAWHRWQSAANCVTIDGRASDGLRKGDIDGEGSAERQQRGQEAKVGQGEGLGVGLQEVAGGDGPGAKPAGEEILK